MTRTPNDSPFEDTLALRLRREHGLELDDFEPEQLRVIDALPLETQVRLLTAAATERWPLERLRTEAANAVPPPVLAEGAGIRVRRSDERPRRKRPEFGLDENNRVIRLDREPEAPRRAEKKRREPPRRVAVLDVPDDTVARRGAPSAEDAPTVRQVEVRSPSGPPVRPPARGTARAALEPEAAERLVALHVEQGYSVVELAHRMGLEPYDVRQTLLATGRGQVRSWRGRIPAGSEVPAREVLAAELAQGLEAIAARHDVSLARVRAWLEARGLTVDHGSRTERTRMIDGQEAALVRLPEGVLVTVDAELAPLVLEHPWEVDDDGRPVTPLGGDGSVLPLSFAVLGVEPGQPAEVTHRNGNKLDCRRGNLVRHELPPPG